MKNLSITDSGFTFLTREKIDLIKNLYCKKASDLELRLFLDICETRKLDPVLKQIYAIFRYDKNLGKDVMSIQVGIDGFRALASRTGEYAGSDEPIFEHARTDLLPSKASVTVYRMVQRLRCAFTASAHWEEYCPKGQDFMWQKMPHSQLAKCAETLALRKAFPAEASGLYEPAEMNQAGFINEAEEVRPAPIAKPTVVSLAKPAPVSQPPPPRDFEEPGFFESLGTVVEDLGETVIPSGIHKGVKLKEKSVPIWQAYVTEVSTRLKQPNFPADKREDAKGIVVLIEKYLASIKS